MKDIMNLFENGKNHLDIYLNYRCNLRCNHCFVGNELERLEEMPLQSALNLLRYAKSQGAMQVSFLGGEPTLYKHLTEVVNEAIDLNYHDIKIITNGMSPLKRFLNSSKFRKKPTIVFSFDSSNKEIMESIRGKGTFKILKSSVDLAMTNGFSCGAIMSVSNTNYESTLDTIKHLDSKGFDYVNVHHVNELGFAQKSNVVSIEDWIGLGKKISSLSKDLEIIIKYEEKFVKITEYHGSKSCVLKENVDGNIMIFPDGKAYRCALFFGDNNLNSLIWDGHEIKFNAIYNEKVFCNSTSCDGCPMSSRFIEKQNEYVMTCMYNKRILNNKTCV